MGQLLKINTAFRRWFFIKGYNSTSAVSLGSGLSLVPDGLTGLTITATIAKNGASGFSNPNAGALTLTEVSGGWYYGDFGTADADTAGPLKYLLSWDGNTEGDQDQVVADLPGGAVADVTLAASQPNYAPAKAGDEMDLVDAPNATALTAVGGAVRTGVGLATANLDDQLAEIEAETDDIAAVKAKTDALPADPADASDIAGTFATVNGTLGTIAGYIDTEIAAIKAKTDQLTFSASGVVADAVALGGSAYASSFLALWYGASLTGTVSNTFTSPTTTVFDTNVTTDKDRYSNQVIYWSTGANLGLYSRVSGYAYTGDGRVRLTLDAALPVTPSNSDQFLAVGRLEAGGSGLDAAGVRAAVGLASANLDTHLDAVKVSVGTGAGQINASGGKVPATLAAADVSGTISVGLAAGAITTASIADDAITDAKIAVPAQTAGIPTRFLAMCRRSWEWTTRRRVRNRTTGQVQLFGANGTTVLETQTQTTVGSVDTISTGV